MRQALLLLAAGWLVLATPAKAQLAPGYSGFSGAPREATDDQYWSFLRELGRCLAQSKRAQSAAFMRTRSIRRRKVAAFGALISRRGHNACMRNMVRATVMRAHVRGVIAENLYKSLPVFASGESIPRGLPPQGRFVRSTISPIATSPTTMPMRAACWRRPGWPRRRKAIEFEAWREGSGPACPKAGSSGSCRSIFAWHSPKRSIARASAVPRRGGPD